MRRDGYKLIMQGLATMVRIAQSEDLKYALPAGQWLVEYGEGVVREKRVTKVEVQAREMTTRDSVIAELRGLYAKALGESPLIVDVEPEAQPATGESKR